MNTAQASQQPLHKRKLWYLLPIFIPLIAGGAVLHFQRLHQADVSPPAERSAWALQTGEVERGSLSGSLQSVAVIDTPNAIVLSPQIQGTALVVGPRAGVAVKRGTLLVRIDSRAIARNLSALQQQHAAALADADYAAKQQARIDAVLAEGGVSRSQADQARTAADSARAKAQSLADQIAALRVQLGYAEIRAPQDAVVAQRLVEVGDTVTPGKPVYELTAGKGAVVKVSLPAANLTHVHVGDTLILRQGGSSLKLSVSRLAPAVNAAGLGTLEADAPVAPFGLPSGSTVAAEVRTRGIGEALNVPSAALVGSGSGAHVMVFAPGSKPGTPGRLHLVPVKVLQQGSERTAVQGALSPGAQVAVGQTAVLAQLHEGDAAVAGNGAGVE
jgi:RND family efflux transporter MFP subunit